MGGSFNPAHDGHRHVAQLALQRLGLDEIWWLVTPQNPLKPVAGMAPFAERLAQARHIARHPLIRPTGLEARLGTRYTADMLLALTRRFPTFRFVWIMGADCLPQFSSWHRWKDIFHTVPVAVFDRPSYSLRAMAGLAAKRFARNRVSARSAASLVLQKPPAWAFLHTRRHTLSATRIRHEAGGGG
ncbi:MAG: nicotinate-nucleotide adenylyltransferase [Alphaproteobacteria bacterium]|nr:nicotinate-nucleotide adenylyltransferase [Alphaproteobacteria bacterium]MBU0798457.1 nicotinate-nucleotide adenylyltransferase [Alphaproteobacteria bacterium]MBU0888415.1 nicotinate-nucleotide adenylyltransferase [Alphaproteobacteria bacterium]MBU1814726.1 nicotinate-nucleotide adenylyltransferase [Alphaproteobacteria bacterium]MBU2089611.1 nicotinate-nucleotide adenylyltransferase [Alphaproteobacteria bacterium]